MRKVLFGILVILYTPWVYSNEKLLDFAYGITVSLKANQIYEFEIPERIYNDLQNRNLYDLRIFGPNGNIMPQWIIQPHKEIVSQVEKQKTITLFAIRESQAGSDINLHVERNSAGVIVNVPLNKDTHSEHGTLAYLADLGEKHAPSIRYISLDLASYSDTIVHVKILTSNDLHRWTTAGNGPLFMLKNEGSVFAQKRVAVIGIMRYIKIVLDNTSERKLLGARVVYDSTTHTPAHMQWTNAKALNQPDDNLFYYQIPVGLPVSAFQVIPKTDMAIQNISLSSGSSLKQMSVRYTGNVYNLKLDNTVYSRAPIPLSRISQQRYWSIKVLASNQQQVLRPQLSFAWQPQHVQFLSSVNGTYTIAFGNVNIKQAASSIPFSIKNKEHNIIPLSLPSEVITLSGDNAFKPNVKPETRAKIVLWTILTLVLVVMGYMTVRLVRHMKDSTMGSSDNTTE